LTKLDIDLETKKLLIFKMISIINKNKMIFKLVSKLAIKILVIYILYFNLVSKRLRKTKLKYKVVSN